MKYIPGPVLDRRSDELWRAHDLVVGFDIEALVDDLELSLLWEPVPDEGGGGEGDILGLLDPDERRIVLNERHLDALEANGGCLKRFTVAHEIGHWCFHCDDARSGTLSLFHGGRIWCRSGSRHNAERQAEMFAGRLLVPRALLLQRLPRRDWHGWSDVYELAQSFVVSPTAMIVRLEELGFAHLDDSRTPRSGKRQAQGQQQLF